MESGHCDSRLIAKQHLVRRIVHGKLVPIEGSTRNDRRTEMESIGSQPCVTADDY
jgi:hypothetical protein